ncbi:MAG: helix-turn-helix transcriptional regulator, partial [Gordonibacter sp.]
MQAWYNFKQTSNYRVFILTIVSGLYWVWWDSFHEIGRFFMQVPLPFELVFTRYSTVSCFFKPVGIVLGCILIYFFLRKSKGFLFSERIPIVLFAAEAILHVLYYGLIICKQYFLSCLVYLVISMCIVLSILLAALQVKYFSRREIIIVVIGSIAGYGMLNNFVFPFFLLSTPLVAIGFIYLIPLIAAYILSCKSFKQNLTLGQPEQVKNTKTPIPLIVHLAIYGLAFGILHVIGGSISKGPYSINIAVFFASLVTIACLSLLFFRKSSNHEIWSKIRSTVFPLSVIGYLLIPLVSNSNGALALTEAGNLLYNAIFFIGCFTLMRKTYVDPRLIIVKGLFYKNLGVLIGILWAREFYEKALFDSIIPSALPVVIVFLLAIATFWVGSDERIRKIWGLRKNLSPKQYNDHMLQLKCATASNNYGLTAREEEIFLLLAQGIRAPEIKESLGISVDTVRSHIKHLYAKLDAHSLSDLRKILDGIDIENEKIEK